MYDDKDLNWTIRYHFNDRLFYNTFAYAQTLSIYVHIVNASVTFSRRFAWIRFFFSLLFSVHFWGHHIIHVKMTITILFFCRFALVSYFTFFWKSIDSMLQWQHKPKGRQNIQICIFVFVYLMLISSNLAFESLFCRSFYKKKFQCSPKWTLTNTYWA